MSIYVDIDCGGVIVGTATAYTAQIKTKDNMNTEVEKQIWMLDPSRIKADKNYRFGLLKTRVESMKDSIIEQGGVQTAIEVVELEGDENFTHEVIDGHYRLAGLLKANDSGAGLYIPAEIHEPLSDIDRVKRQLMHNTEREDNSPMDDAKAMKALLDAGVPRIEIRTMFKRRAVGNQIQPASNSFVNMTISFLELPKKIQKDIHEGLVGVAAAYELMKAYKVAQSKGIDPKAKVDEIYDDAKNETLKRLEEEDADETKFLESEKKTAQEGEKIEAAKKALADAKAEADKVVDALVRANDRSAQAFADKKKATDDEAKKAAQEAFKAAEAVAREAERLKAIKQKEVEKAEAKVSKLEADVQERANKLKELREQKKAEAKEGKVEVKAGTVAKAAAKAGAGDAVPLNATEMRKVVTELAIPGSYPIVSKIGEAFKSCFAGVLTDKMLYTQLAKITGEWVAPKSKKA